MLCPHCNSFSVLATSNQTQSNQSLLSLLLSCRLLHSPAPQLYYVYHNMSITTSQAIITCPLSLLQLESKFHKGRALCAAVRHFHEWMDWLSTSQSLQGLPSPLFFHFTPICTNTQPSPKDNTDFHGPLLCHNKLSSSSGNPPKYQQCFSNFLQEASNPREYASFFPLC